MYHYFEQPFDFETIDKYKLEGKAIEATMGGLLLGRPHAQGGIYFMVKRGNRYLLEGEVEGYEYLMNPGATAYFKEFTAPFHEFDKTQIHYDYLPASNILTLDANHPEGAKYLLFDTGGFAIFNKISTKGYLNTLDKMNRSVSYEPVGTTYMKLIHNNRDEIDIYFYNEFKGRLRKR